MDHLRDVFNYNRGTLTIVVFEVMDNFALISNFLELRQLFLVGFVLRLLL